MGGDNNLMEVFLKVSTMEKGGRKVDVLSGEVEVDLHPYVCTFLIQNGDENIVGKALRFAIWSEAELGNVIQKWMVGVL